ncbi:hypothetical protein [Hyphomicrobium sp.]|uniref:hypothetical protein n=1 Tax=Hyphomicrobium sp. TaxID=82 RepID=UPI000FAAA91E|nr:hypothetical protein [Hyphomicrobium sp.]RUP11239.1 MAG: hypothetical protein EKK38_01965 [Hyphomicrobium sp.]
MPGTPRFLPPSNYSLLGNSAVISRSIRTSLFRATVGVLMVSCSASAVNAANCGAASLGGGAGGPPSISATESSTTQVLEEIRRRTQLAQAQAQPIPASYTTTADAPPAASSASAEAKAAQAASSGGAAAKKPTYTKTASAQPAGKDGYVYSEYAGSDRIVGSWGQGFLDYERHSNIAPGQQENTSRTSKTAGVMSGTDWTWVNSGARQAIQAGFFSGYSATFNTFGNTQFNSYSGQSTEFDAISRTNNKQQIDGSFLGAYVAAIRGNATFDLAFKADLFDLRQSSVLTQVDGGPGNEVGCVPAPKALETGSASVNNYTIAADAAYRYDVSPSTWYEPIFSIRYTITDYGDDPTHLTSLSSNPLNNVFGPPGRLGLEDGTVLRLQAGIRRGQQGVLPDGGLWTVVGGAFIYSDVAITGFKYSLPASDTPGTVFGTNVFPVDEGKVRGLGQILTTFDYANGWSYLLMGEVRGGEDLIGVGGRAGARYRW